MQTIAIKFDPETGCYFTADHSIARSPIDGSWLVHEMTENGPGQIMHTSKDLDAAIRATVEVEGESRW